MITDPRISATIVLYHASPSVLETVKSIVNSEEQIQLYVVENSDRPVIQRLKRHFRRKQAEPVQKSPSSRDIPENPAVCRPSPPRCCG